MNPSGKISRHFLIIRLANRWSIVLFEFEKWYRIKMVWINSSYCMFPLIRLENVQSEKCPIRKCTCHICIWNLKIFTFSIMLVFIPSFEFWLHICAKDYIWKKIYNFRTYVPEMIFFTWFTYMEVSGWRRTGLVSQCYRFNNRMKKSSWEIILSLFKLNFFFLFSKKQIIS